MALSAMKLRKLKELMNQPVEIITSDGITISGTVSDNDGETLEIVGNARTEYVEYTEIERFSILDALPEADRVEVSAAVLPVTSMPVPSPSVPLSPTPATVPRVFGLPELKRLPFWRESSLTPSTSEIGTLFNNLPIEINREFRNTLQGVKDRLISALERNDETGKHDAFASLRRLCRNHPQEAERFEAAYFLGYMTLFNSAREAHDFFLRGGCLAEAAMVLSQQEDCDYKKVAELCMKVLLRGNQTNRIQSIFSLLCRAVLSTGDFTPISILSEQGGSTLVSYRLFLEPFLNGLAEFYQISLTGTLQEKTAQLLSRIPGGMTAPEESRLPCKIFAFSPERKLVWANVDDCDYEVPLSKVDPELLNFMNRCSDDLEQQPVDAVIRLIYDFPRALESSEKKTRTLKYYSGKITSLPRYRQNGKILTADGREFTFGFDDVQDRGLLQQLDTFNSVPDFAMRNILVAFNYRFGTNCAVSIISASPEIRATLTFDTPDDLLQQSRAIRTVTDNPNRFREANEILSNLFSSRVGSDALSDYIENVNSIYRVDLDDSMLRLAELVYQDNRSRYPNNLGSLRNLLVFARRRGERNLIQESANKLCALNKSAMLDDENQIINLTACATAFEELYLSFSDPTDLEAAGRYAKAAFALIKNKQTDRQLSSVNPRRLFYAIWSGDLKTAEEILDQRQRYLTFELDLDERTAEELQRLRELNAELEEEIPVEAEEVSSIEAEEVSPSEAVVNEPGEPLLETAPSEDSELSEEKEAEEDEYQDPSGWEDLSLTTQDAVDTALSFDGQERLASLVAYLKATSSLNKELLPLYRLVSLAVDNPLEEQDYTPEALYNRDRNEDNSFQALAGYTMGAALLRSAFSSAGKDSYYYLNAMASIPELSSCELYQDILKSLLSFVQDHNRSLTECIQLYAKRSDKVTKEALKKKAQALYLSLVLTPPAPDPAYPAFQATKARLYHQDRDYIQLLSCVANGYAESVRRLRAGREQFFERYVVGQRITEQVVNSIVGADYLEALRSFRAGYLRDDLTGYRRGSLTGNVSTILDTVFQWYELDEENDGTNYEDYRTLSPLLAIKLRNLADRCAKEEENELEDRQKATGLFLLGYTVTELADMLTHGAAVPRELFFADFLRNDLVELDENFLPDFDCLLCGLPTENLPARIARHAAAPRLSDEEHLWQIYRLDSVTANYGTAKLILRRYELLGQTPPLKDISIIEEDNPLIAARQNKVEQMLIDFTRLYARADTQGILVDASTFLRSLPELLKARQKRCASTKNFGLFTMFHNACMALLTANDLEFEKILLNRLGNVRERHPEYFEGNDLYSQIQNYIDQHYFSAAERLLANLSPGMASLPSPEPIRELRNFMMEYPGLYMLHDAEGSLAETLRRRGITLADGQILIDRWISDPAAVRSDTIQSLLSALGWTDMTVNLFYDNLGLGEIYEAQRSSDGEIIQSFSHSVPPFSSQLEQESMYVSCFYGSWTTEKLLESFRQLSRLQGSRLVLLNSALASGERRELAFRIKRMTEGFSTRYPIIVLDTVMLLYLASHYNASSVNRMLMSIAMPFSLSQPYVPDSINDLPPELFIGRLNEQNSIFEPSGANIVYGGRQLGKSALLQRVAHTHDGVNGCRVLYIDLRQSTTVEAVCTSVSEKLIQNGILAPETLTDSWNELSKAIARYLSDSQCPTKYLLLLLDEADLFLKDAMKDGYMAIGELKTLQYTFHNRFKFVLAGLHDVVQFSHNQSLENNSTFGHLSNISVKPFTDDESLELLTKPLSYLGFSINEPRIAQIILAQTSGFPGLVHLFAKMLIEAVRIDYGGFRQTNTPPYVINENHVNRVLADDHFRYECQKRLEMTLLEDRMGSGGLYFPLVLLIALMDLRKIPDCPGFTADQILEHADGLVDTVADLSKEKLLGILEELTDLNILRKEVLQAEDAEERYYDFALSTFRGFLGTETDILNKLSKLSKGD